jgi:MFS family permease
VQREPAASHTLAHMNRARAFALFRFRHAWRRFWLAQALSLGGDWFSLVAVSVLSLTANGGGTVALAITLAAHLAPQALLSPFAGHLADRFDRRRLLIAGSVIEGLLTLLMLEAARRGNVPALQLFVLLRAAMATLREPAAGSALPRLVEREELGVANAMMSATWSVCFAMGMALGGLVTEISPVFALAVDAATFFGSALLLAGLPALPPEPRAPGARRSSWAEAGVTLRLALGKDLRAFLLAKTPVALAAGGGWIALNLVARARPELGGESATLGVLQAVRGVGTGVGPILALWAISRGVRRDVMDHLAAGASFLGIVALVLAPNAGFALPCTLLWGAGAGANWVLTTTVIQERAPPEFLGRLIGAEALFYTLAMTGTALLSAVVLDAGVALGPATALGVGLGAVSWIALRWRPTPEARPVAV